MFKIHRQRQMTQKQLAEETGVNQRTIEAYESKQRDINLAKPKVIYKIAIALGIPAYKVVDDNELVKLMKKERRIK